MSASVTPDSPWRCPPRIGLDGFTKLLQTKGKDGQPNIGLLAERDPMAFYDAIRGEGVDPLYILAVFWHESQFGTDGMAKLTKSWGNTRPPSFGAPQLGVLNNFSTYRDWLDGCKSTVGRLVDTAWVYYARERIRDVYDWPDGQVWAPAGDNNDPAGYLRAVIDFMNAHADQGAPPMGSIPKPPMDTSHPSPNRDGYSTPRKVEAVVWHISQGNLASNLSWLTNPASNASSNYEIAKDGTIYELVPPDHSAWANGIMQKPNLNNPLIAAWAGGKINPNTRTVSIEHEGFSSNNQGGALTAEQVDAHTRLTAWLCQEFGLPADRTHILGHFEIDDVDRPFCPGFSSAEWIAYVASVATMLAGVPPAPPTAPPANERSINGFWVASGFLELYSALEVAGLNTQVLGLPLSNEIAGPFPGVDSCQKWERGWLLWQHDQNPQVTIAHRMWWPQLEAL